MDKLDDMTKTVFWLYLSALVVLSLLPTDQLPGGIFNFWDKAQHGLGFALLTVLALRAYTAPPRWRTGFGLLVFGGLIELSQATTGWRLGEWTDLLADAVGIALALTVWPAWKRHRKSTEQ